MSILTYPLLSPWRIQNWRSLSDVEISWSASLIAMAVLDPSLPSRSRSPAKCSPQGASGARNGTCPADPATAKTSKTVTVDSSQLIGLDFDCTITVRHFYKSVANLLMGKPMAHPHCAIFHAWLKKEGGETGGQSTDRCPLDGFSRGDLEPRLRCWSLPSFDPWGLFGRRRTNPASHSMVCPQGPRGHSLCHHHRRCCKQRFHGTGSSSRMGPVFPHRCGLRLVSVKTSGAIHHRAKRPWFWGTYDPWHALSW